MAYTPTTWVTGDTITAVKLNNMEQGIANAGGTLICKYTVDAQAQKLILDKTAQEIINALSSGVFATLVAGDVENGGVYCYQCNIVFFENDTYHFTFQTATAVLGTFVATSLSAYPEWSYA